jgi:beta-mannosidase
VSEYGLQSFPEMKTIRAFASDSDLAYRSGIMEHRQRSQMPWIGKNFNGNEMIKTYIGRYYKVPENFKQFAYVSQLMQAEGVKYAIETHRSNMPRCMGSLYWQINDCWPTMSWSSVDYFGRWKALHYAVKKAFQPIYPIIDTVGNEVNIFVASDKLMDTRATISIKLYNFSGKIIWQKEIAASIAANTSKLYESIPKSILLAENDGSASVLEVVVKKAEEIIAGNLYYLKEYKVLQLQKPIITKTIKKLSSNKYELTLKTNTLAKNVAFFTGKTEGFFSDNYFDMLPGRTYRITFTGAAVDLAKELEVMCLNEAYD